MQSTTSLKHPSILSGLICVALLTAFSYYLSQLPWLTQLSISPLIIAIIAGMTIGNTITLPPQTQTGVQFAAKKLLRLAIILYGFRVSFQQISAVGTEALLIDSIVVVATLGLGYLVGSRLFKLDQHLALLISAGAAICGAAAVLAVEDILKSEPHKAAIAVGTVVLFGTLSMFIYPLLQHAHFFGFTGDQFGLFAGASIHEVAQVLAAGTNISPETGNIAVIVKMIRVILLVPVLICLSSLQQASSKDKKRLIVPWFALGFVAVIGIHSLNIIPSNSVSTINIIDTLLLTMAMGAIGLETKFAKIKQVGIAPLYLASFLFIWLFSSVFFMVNYF